MGRRPSGVNAPLVAGAALGWLAVVDFAVPSAPAAQLNFRELQTAGSQAPFCTVLVLQDPFAERTVYKDNFLDKLFIKLYSRKMAALLPGTCIASLSHFKGASQALRLVGTRLGSIPSSNLPVARQASLCPRSPPTMTLCASVTIS